MTSCSGGSSTSEVSFEAAPKRERLAAVEAKLTDASLWDDPASAQRLLKERGRLQESVELDRRLGVELDDARALFELQDEGEDVAAEVAELLERLTEEVRTTELRMLLSGELDRNDAVLAIHPGAGGTESQDWAEMLFRQYLRYCERKGFKVKVLDYQPGDEAGIKSATMSVEGDYAYGLLAAERGVHRLVRISPYDQAKRRHTSFASVFVYPQVDEVEVEVRPEDLRIDTYRSSGSGGQHVNVTDSAVRITHLPTNTVVQCQNERSQHRNKESAMRVLKARLYDLMRAEQSEKAEQETGEKRDIAFGSQIRSYVLQPYKLVKDHRTGIDVTNPDRVLDGDLDDLIYAFLSLQRRDSAAPASAN